MRETIARTYQRFRDPGNFLRIVLLFISASLTLHFAVHYDPDWGATNLILSIEATVASAALMLLARENQRRNEESARMQAQMLETLLQLAQSDQRALERGGQLLQDLIEHDKRSIATLERLADALARGAPSAQPQEP